MKSRIGNIEWIVLMVVMGVIDLIQFVIIECILVWFFGAGAAINEVIDPIVGILLAGYLLLRRVSPSRYWKCYGSILGMAALEEITGGIAQLWILDVWYMRSAVTRGEAEDKTAAQALENNAPLNDEGTRLPAGTEGSPLNVDGVRLSTQNLAINDVDNVKFLYDHNDVRHYQMPSGEKIEVADREYTPAVMIAGGRIFSGKHHIEAVARAKRAGAPSGMRRGFVTKTGEFLDYMDVGRRELAKKVSREQAETSAKTPQKQSGRE